MAEIFVGHPGLYLQQKEMFDKKVHSVDHRIVSIHQPHVRPIVRGKARNRTEFGAKIHLSLVDGYSFLDTISWDAYNEAKIGIHEPINTFNSVIAREAHYLVNLIHLIFINYETKTNKKTILGFFTAMVFSLAIMQAMNMKSSTKDISMQQLGAGAALMSGTEGASPLWNYAANTLGSTAAGMTTVGLGSIYITGTNPVGWTYWAATGGIAL